MGLEKIISAAVASVVDVHKKRNVSQENRGKELSIQETEENTTEGREIKVHQIPKETPYEREVKRRLNKLGSGLHSGEEVEAALEDRKKIAFAARFEKAIDEELSRRTQKRGGVLYEETQKMRDEIIDELYEEFQKDIK